MSESGHLTAMDESHIEAATGIMARGRDATVGERAKATFRKHFALRKLGLDDGRRYFVWIEDGHVAGVTGLHQYSWGPEENVWLAYFGVHPDFARRGIGSVMLGEMQRLATERRYRKFFIETHGANERAHRFYRSQGFREVGSIADYNPDGAPMIVFAKELV